MSMIGKTRAHYSAAAQIAQGSMGKVDQAKNQTGATSCLESGEDLVLFEYHMDYLHSKIRARRSLQ
jgi:hypothetical protein